MNLKQVVAAWRVADPKHIHPTREHESEMAYWRSGEPQAQFVANLLPEGSKVLDFGCGDGRIAIPLAKLGFHVVAVDAAPEMLERLGHNWRRLDDPPWGNLTTQLSDGTDILKVVAGQFDAINARAVFIHHRHTDVIRMVKNLAQLIKPGGYLVCDWPIGKHHERVDWIDITTWEYEHRAKVAESAGLTLVTEGEPRVRPSVWQKQ